MKTKSEVGAIATRSNPHQERPPRKKNLNNFEHNGKK
jgi:hypothetical protein